MSLQDFATYENEKLGKKYDGVMANALDSVSLCFVIGRRFTLTVPLSTQDYKWVLAANCWGVTCDGLASHPGEVAILLAASCYRNQS